MDNACDSNMSSSCRTFGHCIVTWEIQNYGRALWQKNLEIETPEFFIKGANSQDTKWKLILKTESNHNSLVEELNVTVKFKENEENVILESEETSETDLKSSLSESEKEKSDFLCLNENKNVDSRLSMKNLMMYLERGCSDEGPDRVCVDCKVYYIGIKGEKVSLVHDEHFFHEKIKYGFNIGTLYDFERDFEYNSGFTTILCDIIVTDTDSSHTFNDEMSIDYYGLSEDLQWIFDSQKLCDAELNVDGKRVKAHKAILCSHSKFFRSAVEKGSDVSKLSDMKYNEVLKVLEYMYSHNLKDVIGKPSISVYNAAIQINLRDLAAHYAPEEVTINTKLDIKKLTYQWVISDFTNKTSCISSSILKNNHGDTAWQIHLYPKGIDGKSEYISLTVECIDGNITEDLCIQCAVLRNNENLNLWKNVQKTEDNNTVVTDEKFILREDVFKMLNKDSLRLGFKVRTCSGKESSIVKKPCSPVLYSMKKSFENMAKHMLYIRESNKYTDVTFHFGKKKIKAHKFILSARSHMFRRKFEETCDHMPLINIHPETFEIILDYIYCATFNVSNINTVIDVYKFAEQHLIPRLQEKCSRFLQNSIKVDNATRILILANECDDKYLKETADEFIATNENVVKEVVYLKKPKTEAFPKQEDDIVSAACITKSTSVIKYNEITIVSYDFELAERPFNGNVTQTKQNGKSSPDNTAAMKDVSDEVVSECLEDLHSNEENKSLAERQKPIVNYIDYSSKPTQSDQLDVPSKKYSNGIGFSNSIAATKANEQLQQDNEIRYVHIDSKGNEINESEPNKPKEVYQNLQVVLRSFQEVRRDLETGVAAKPLDGNGQAFLDEHSGSNLKSNIGKNEPQKGFKLDAALNELQGNGQESLDEPSGSNLKSNAGQNESRKEDFKVDTALSELHGNGQESLDKQNGTDLQCNLAHETDASLLESHE